MAAQSLFFFFSLFVLGFVEANLTSPYLSPATFFPNYQKMLDTFKIFVYEPEKNSNFNTPAESLFHSSLLKSNFLTTKGDEAHLFYVSFPHDLSRTKRSISHSIRDIRMELPFWNRTLGADHFYLSCKGLAFESDRNILELKKNSIQISCLSVTKNRFIPHKDLTLPPLTSPLREHPRVQINRSARLLAYCNDQSSFLNELRVDPDFLIEAEPSDQATYADRLSSSAFCLFFYGSDVSGVSEALRFGCVPVVISDRPILNLPFLDVLRWSNIAVFVGTSGGVKELKNLLERTACGDKYERMRDLGKIASQHFVWNLSPQPYDSFYTIMYQLWLRRHTIRYSRRESI